jgi:hypothetical protein
VAGGIDRSTNAAIQTIEAYLGASNMSPRIRDTWKRVQSAIEQLAGPRREKGGGKGVLDQIAKDIQKTLQIVKKRGPKLALN